ncbi:S8 family serine peptidase [Kribbella sp. NPDC049174]|uniref:S8 family peptidase n=1 Tax=Kribbella sp. NPDC049174 TaxID=3364112 RepID=UPI00371DB2C4
MSDNQNSGGNDNPPADDSNDKFEDQINLILAEFGDEIEIDPPDWRTAGVNSIYRAGSVLVRDHDAPRTLDLFRGGDVRRSRLGVTQLDLPAVVPADAPGGDRLTPTQRFLEQADVQLGRGTVTPDHLVYVCKSVSPCPATEPEVVSDGAAPEPFLSMVGKADGRGVKVVVLDVGWTEAPHARWLDGVTGEEELAFDPETGLIRPYAGHGTFIAGVVRAIAPKTEVVVKSYFDKAGAMFEVDLADRLAEALAEDPDIISLSAGSKTRFDIPSLALGAFSRPRENSADGPVLVAAAGNDGDDRQFWPAAHPEAVSVGALAADETSRASFSNFGSWVDVYAPGENLVNAFLTGEYQCTERPNKGQLRKFAGMARWSGTSFSTPVVAGLIAARISLTGERPKQAANALLAYSRTRVLPDVGPVLLPGDARASTK